MITTSRGGSRKFRKRGPSPPPSPPQMKTSFFRTCSNKVTLMFQKHFENSRKKGGHGPLGPSPNPRMTRMSLGSTRLRANIDLDQSKRNFQLALLASPFWPLEKIILLCELYSFSGKNGCPTFSSLQTNELVTRKAYVQVFI